MGSKCRHGLEECQIWRIIENGQALQFGVDEMSLNCLLDGGSWYVGAFHSIRSWWESKEERRPNKPISLARDQTETSQALYAAKNDYR